MSDSKKERDRLIYENKIICEFLGAELQGGYDNKELGHTELYCFKSDCSPTNLRTYSTGAMRFHKEYNWIMLVVGEISNLNFSEVVGLKEKIGELFPFNLNQLFIGVTNIHTKVVALIEWYNENKK
jgi:hypothetical protein